MNQSARKKENGGTCRRQIVDSLSCRSALLLSVVCCIAMIHVELKIQEHHRLISSSVTHCDQMDRNILEKVPQNNKEWQPTRGSHLRGQRQQTTGRFSRDVNDQVMLHLSQKQLCQSVFSYVPWSADHLIYCNRQPKIFHGEKTIFRW